MAAGATVACCGGAVWAAANDEAGAQRASEAALIAEVALLLLLGRGLGEMLQRLKQPAVLGQLLAGLLLGPSVFGWIAPQLRDLVFPSAPAQAQMLSGLSSIAVLLLLLLTGMETDLKLARRVGASAIAVAGFGVAVPFCLGVGLGMLLPQSLLPEPRQRLVTAFLLGIALSISSIKIVGVVVREMNFMRRNLGQIIVASAMLEDTAAWILISIAFGISRSGGLAVLPLVKTLIGTTLFLAFSYTIGRRLTFWLIRWVNDHFVSEYAVVTAILVVMCAMSLITESIGVNVALGAFVAGVLVGQSPILSREIDDELRGLITAFMMPIFFGLSGLSANLTILGQRDLALLTLGLIVVASLGKFAGAFAGGLIGRLSAAEALALGCGMNARGSTEVIVASLGLAAGVLTQSLYTMIVTMAIVTTLAMPPALRWALARLPLREEERRRLEREEIDAKGFVSRFERLLVAGDESANGQFASRLAGFIAGQRGAPITVLHLDPKGREKPRDEPLRETATEAVEAGREAASAHEEGREGLAEVSARVETRVEEAVERESAKGYDLLFIGLERMLGDDGNFSREVDRAAAGFDGPLALAVADPDARVLAAKGLKFLVAVNGTEAARRGAEMTFALSRAQASRVEALYVAEGSSEGRRRPQQVKRLRQSERAILDDVVTLGRRYGCERITTSVSTDAAPGAAIVEAAKRHRCDLIVIGAARRVGTPLFLGQTVSWLVRNWSGALLLIAV